MRQVTKRTFLKTTAASAVLVSLPMTGALAKAGPAAAKIDRPLAGAWTFRQGDTYDWMPATVPGTVHTDLLANSKIDDPFYRTNEHDQQWIDKKDWEYRTTFTLDAATLARDHVELVFKGLDTYADVYVNDALVLSADNMFREWTADIKPHAKSGMNSLRVYFHSPIREGLKRLADFGFNPPATNDQSENGGLGDKKVSPFTRKAGYHYGWDWGPRFVTSGLWRPVRLRAWNKARIETLQIIQNSLAPEKADLTAVFEIVSDVDGPALLDIRSPGNPAIKASLPVTLKAGVNTIPVALSIARPKLWWSNGLGEAHLYSLTGRLSRNGAALDTRDATIGLRTLKIVQQPDDAGTSFYVELNGVPVFMKGANYIPNDSFLTRVTPAVHDKVVQSAKATHMNMLRVWGGGVYEEDYFYDQCDRNGILIWHDFMFACSMYPNDAAFLDNVRQEAIYNVKRLRNHPSIALWVGNNEIDAAWQNDVPNGGWGWKQLYTEDQRTRMWEAYDAIFNHILPEVVAEHDPQRFYWPSSPLAAWDGKTVKHADLATATQSGDIHYWDVWWGQKPFSDYRTHIGRFMSEYGFQSFPEFRTVKAYTEAGDWDIFSDVMKAHQRSSIGNGTIKNYMQRDYVVPADFQQFLYVGQVLQAEGIKVAMEAHRSRMPYCMGSLFWQINDCWPVASWSSIDYYGRWKAQQYFAVKAYAPVLVAPVIDGDTVTVTAVSDLRDDRRGLLVVRVIDFDGNVRSLVGQHVDIKANSSAVVFSGSVHDMLRGAAPSEALLSVQLYDLTRGEPPVMSAVPGQPATGGVLLSSNIAYFAPIKDVKLPVPVIQTTVKSVGRDIAVSLNSARLVKNLCLSLDDIDGRFSDNYFDILPGEPVIVTFTPDRPLTLQAFRKQLKLMHMAQIKAA